MMIEAPQTIQLPSPAETEVLRLLQKHGESSGLTLLKSSKLLFRNTAYVLLNRMTEKGLITAREESAEASEVGLPRRLYKLTSLGLSTLAEATREQLPPPSVLRQKTDDDIHQANRAVVDFCLQKSDAGWCQFCPFDRPHNRRHQPACPLVVNGFINAQGKRLR